MGWQIGVGENGRDIGYGVPAICDAPKCSEKIDRGLSYCCGEFVSENGGCGLYFCGSHLLTVGYGDDEISSQLCDPCAISWKLWKMDEDNGYKLAPAGYKPKKDVLEWVIWKIYHESWQTWRDNNPEKYGELKKRELHAAVTSRKIARSFRDEEGFICPTI